MSFFSRIVRFIFWLLVVSWSVALLRRAIGWMLRGAAGNPMQGTDELGAAQASDTIRHLVRDPVCGTHVAEEVAIALGEGGELVHFCSPACRDAYTGVARKLSERIGEFASGMVLDFGPGTSAKRNRSTAKNLD